MTPGPARPDTGLVIGKFLPPHRGHQYLLDFARAYCRRLTVLVCTLQREPFPAELRLAWVRELAPGAAVLHHAEENPSFPHEHPDFWDLWTRSIRRLVPAGPDAVFSSEDYGDELARRLGARHIVVDKARELVPVSGTAIRADPIRHWTYLPDCVRPHFVKRVVLFGPESTGKTTLARRLAEHFGTVWAAEYARGWLDHQRRAPVEADLEPIALGQAASEDALARQADRVLFADTDAAMTAMYADIYFGRVPGWLDRLADSRRANLTLLTDIDVPWVADPQRDMPHRREFLRDRCVAELNRRGRPFVWIRGTWEERFETARRAVAAFLG